MPRPQGAKYLEKIVKNLRKILKDLEKGNLEKYGLMNPQEAEAFAKYIEEKIAQYEQLLRQARSR